MPLRALLRRFRPLPSLLALVLLAGAAAAQTPATQTPATQTPPSGQGAAPGGVVVSIKPLHSLVAAVTQGVQQPYLIMRGGGSPHAYSLKPSDAAALEAAAAVFWIGPDLELFLAGPLETLAPGARRVALQETAGLRRLTFREGGPFDAHGHAEEDHADEGHDEHGHDEHGHDEHGHDEGGHDEGGHDEGGHDGQGAGPAYDPHYWLDPVNAQVLVGEIARVLAALDPAHAETYAANAAAARAGIDALIAEMAATLAPVAERPFLVFHDAYQYLERRFDLTVAGSITVSPEVLPGARRIAEIRAKVQALGATCVFAEPQFEPRLIRVVVEGTPARAGVLDPLGADLSAGPGLYAELMRRNAAAIRDCLE